MTTTPEKRLNILESFMEGVRNGMVIAFKSMLPAVMFAFFLIQMLEFTGILTWVDKFCQPVMGLFGLPGVAATVLLLCYLSLSGGIGVMIRLVAAGSLSPEHVTILMPAVMLTAAGMQYMGRILGTSGIPGRFFPVIMGIAILDGLIALVLMNYAIMPFFR